MKVKNTGKLPEYIRIQYFGFLEPFLGSFSAVWKPNFDSKYLHLQYFDLLQWFYSVATVNAL